MKKRNAFLLKLFVFISAMLCVSWVHADRPRPNILLIVADDMNYDSPGYAGGVAPDVTPNIDRLARESFSFEQAFTAVSVCQPSRQSMLSGLLPHNYGSAGFFPMAEDIPTLVTFLKASGYLTGNIHKKSHMLPEESFNWDFDQRRLGLTDLDAVVGRDPEAIALGLRRFIEAADENKMPFFMVVNSADPHRPFHGSTDIADSRKGREPSRVYRPEEVTVPPALPDIPEIREDLARYASSVRRLDDTVGQCLSVLEERQKEESTLVIFVSDNGMSFPFGKFDCYFGSSRSPLLMRWPEWIRQPQADLKHLVSLMDLTPTVLELAGLPIPTGLDGRSLVPILEGRSPRDWRKAIVFLRNEDIYYANAIRRDASDNPEIFAELESDGWELRPDHLSKGTYSRSKEIRCYFDGKFGYIYNGWYREDGPQSNRFGAVVPYSTDALDALKSAGDKDPAVKARYQFYLLRANEELYDWSEDPGSQHDLAQHPEYKEVLAAARRGLLEWMESSGDPLVEAYRSFVD